MAINKVDFAGQTLIDLTKDTVTAAKLLKGATAHDKAGNAISGTASGPKPEQEKEITISENGDYPITPDVGKVLSKVLAHVNVPTGGGGGGIPGFDRVEEETWIPAQDTNTCTWTVNGDDIKLVLCMSEEGTVSGASSFVGAVTGFVVNDGRVYNVNSLGIKTMNIDSEGLYPGYVFPEGGEITLDEKFKAAGVYHIWKFYGTGKP